MADIEILYEDGEALVIDKPSGMAVDRPRKGGICLEDHLERLKLGFQRAPVAVHRLDTDTSGCLLLARNPKALTRFNRAFEERAVAKTYLAILAGRPPGTHGTVELALAKISSAEKGWRMIAAKKGKPAISHWELVEELGPHSLIRFRPETGRTHQLRVHALQGLGAPLLGDRVYGAGDAPVARRAMLHAESLAVTRPGKPPIAARAPLPADFRALGASDG
jgi:tRNA pseudouridine32 synthase/23S rRNA pseudouridine746 synthase